MPAHISLKQFDGPLDLLLHLISKAQIDIKDIFVSEITEQYIASIAQADDVDMEDMSEFIVMAATLLEIKSGAMLPKPPKTDEDEEDPEQRLIRQLEEYKRFKETAENLKAFELTARDMFQKLPEEYPLPPPTLELTGLTLQGLFKAMLSIAQRRAEENGEPNKIDIQLRQIQRDIFTVQQCMHHIAHYLRKHHRCRFEELMSDHPSRQEVVTLFLAVLELMHQGKTHIEQNGVYDGIYLQAGRGKHA